MTDETNGRNSDGTFSTGNAGGPGRPRRAIELEYLAAVADSCPPARWLRIVESACVAAEAGDDKARQWLTKYLLGAEPPTLLALARRDVAGVSADDELQAQHDIDSRTAGEMLMQFGPTLTAFERAASAERAAESVTDGMKLLRKIKREQAAAV